MAPKPKSSKKTTWSSITPAPTSNAGVAQEQNSLLTTISSSAADFAFGVMGIPMALAAQKIANPVSPPSNVTLLLMSVCLVFALSVQFGIAMVVSVSAIRQIPAKNWLWPIFCVGLFAILLILISVFPSPNYGQPLSFQSEPTLFTMLFSAFVIIVMCLMVGTSLSLKLNDVAILIIALVVSMLIVVVAMAVRAP